MSYNDAWLTAFFCNRAVEQIGRTEGKSCIESFLEPCHPCTVRSCLSGERNKSPRPCWGGSMNVSQVSAEVSPESTLRLSRVAQQEKTCLREIWFWSHWIYFSDGFCFQRKLRTGQVFLGNRVRSACHLTYQTGGDSFRSTWQLAASSEDAHGGLEMSWKEVKNFFVEVHFLLSPLPPSCNG